ncbi:MAG: zinc ribbon domain-containing protein [Verrucomicrobiota bacterium]
MAFYDYECARCGEFSLWRKLEERNQPAECPHCRRPAERMVTVPSLSLMPSGVRQAHQRNEKSRHEPGVKKRHQCGSGCGCGTSKAGGKKSTRTVDLGKAGRFETSKKVKRPWMLGH